MYSYIYDIFTSEGKYEHQLQKIEGWLAEYGIRGKIYKLNVLKNLEEIVRDVVENGTKNIIAVGNDQTVSKIANLIMNENLVLGLIPVAEPNLLSAELGINSVEEAIKIIAARKIMRLDVGKINGQFFLMSVESSDKNIICDFKEYNINPLITNETVGIYNFNMAKKNFKANPGDGIMEAVFMPREATWWQKFLRPNKANNQKGISVFPVKKLTLKHLKKPVEIILDRQRVLKTPLIIEVLPRKLAMMVGRERTF